MQEGFFILAPEFPIISEENPLLLASGSPRRRKLLEQVGLPFLAFSPGLVEDLSETGPAERTLMLAEKKAKSVSRQSEAQWVLGADTIVVLDRTILGKPQNHEEALSMLLCLNGKEHRVITGFCLLDPLGKLAHLDAMETLVRFKHLTKEEIEAYIATGEPFGKAGSYAIQGIGAFMVEGITGSYTNVVGLPLCALVKALLARGALKTFPLSA
jgi:septum formation protein